MSYDKIKGIKFKDNKEVWFNTTSNNIIPLNYQWYKSESLSKLLIEKGKEAVEIEILKAYENGNFQGGTNKFTKALKVIYFQFTEEYKRFSWINNKFKYGSEENKQFHNLRESEEFKQFLLKCLKFKPTKKFILISQGTNINYALKFTGRRLKWTNDKSRAKIYNFKKEWEQIKNYFSNSDKWEVVEVGQ